MSVPQALLDRLGDMPVTTNERLVRAKSRDFFWYSPVLKETLDHVLADLVVTPRHEADVVTLLAACHDLDVAVTPRGAGTGNYGQAMPLAGGVVLDLCAMNAIHEMRDGVVVAGPGALMGDIDEEARRTLGQELRLHPSTRETATIGGFLAGGSGGVGSIRWGMLHEPGNVTRMRIATMEAEPHLLDLTGSDIEQALHAYGTTGVITQVEMPLAPAPDWVDMLVAFDSWAAALEAGWTLAGAEGLWLKQLAAVEAPAPRDHFKRHARFLHDGEHVLCIMVAPNSADALADLVARLGGRMALRTDRARADEMEGLPHIYHLAWNHTTLRGLRADPAITYLQIGYPEDRPLGACAEIAARHAGEIIGHVEFVRGGGSRRLSGLPLVRYRSRARLTELIGELEAMGCPVWNPHVCTLEEGGLRGADPRQRAWKAANDPKGLLNPGKMIAWDEPGYVYEPAMGYAYQGLREAGTA